MHTDFPQRSRQRRALQDAGIAIGLLLVVYVPAFALVSLIRPPIQLAVPLIIGISLALALASIALLVRRRIGDFAQFGFQWPDARHVVLAMMIGAPLALLVAWLAHVFPANGPLDTSKFPLWMVVLYFGIGSPLQEEVVFRGLLQSFLAQHWTAVRSVAGVTASAPVLLTAALFGLVHLGSGVAVFVGALVLGLAAGELRRRSGSLVPAMIVHMFFNIPGLIWR